MRAKFDEVNNWQYNIVIRFRLISIPINYRPPLLIEEGDNFCIAVRLFVCLCLILLVKYLKNRLTYHHKIFMKTSFGDYLKLLRFQVNSDKD